MKRFLMLCMSACLFLMNGCTSSSAAIKDLTLQQVMDANDPSVLFQSHTLLHEHTEELGEDQGDRYEDGTGLLSVYQNAYSLAEGDGRAVLKCDEDQNDCRLEWHPLSSADDISGADTLLAMQEEYENTRTDTSFQQTKDGIDMTVKLADVSVEEMLGNYYDDIYPDAVAAYYIYTIEPDSLLVTRARQVIESKDGSQETMYESTYTYDESLPVMLQMEEQYDALVNHPSDPVTITLIDLSHGRETISLTLQKGTLLSVRDSENASLYADEEMTSVLSEINTDSDQTIYASVSD